MQHDYQPMPEQPPYAGAPGQPYGMAPAATPPYANWLIRVASYVTDYILPWIISVIVQALVGGHTGFGRGLLAALLSLLSLIIVIYNRWFLLGRTGKSWGKTLTNTQLLGLTTGQPIGAFKSFLRDVLHILDALILYIGFLWPIWDRKRQCLFSDKIMNTVVINDKTLPPPIR